MSEWLKKTTKCYVLIDWLQAGFISVTFKHLNFYGEQNRMSSSCSNMVWIFFFSRITRNFAFEQGKGIRKTKLPWDDPYRDHSSKDHALGEHVYLTDEKWRIYFLRMPDAFYDHLLPRRIAVSRLLRPDLRPFHRVRHRGNIGVREVDWNEPEMNNKTRHVIT